MTDKEIVKALECSPLNDIGGCRKIDALDLINRQKEVPSERNQRMRDRLIKLLNKKYDHFCDQCGINKDSHYTESLADYLLANGVIVPPCKVGDTVYEIVHGEILEPKVVGFLICQDGAILVKTSCSFPLSREIGCCLFLTREEAEAKLRKEDEGK
jgi:hypothetical protein